MFFFLHLFSRHRKKRHCNGRHHGSHGRSKKTEEDTVKEGKGGEEMVGEEGEKTKTTFYMGEEEEEQKVWGDQGERNEEFDGSPKKELN